MASKRAVIILALLSALPSSVANPTQEPYHLKPKLAPLKSPIKDFWQRLKQETKEAMSPDMDVATVSDIVSDGKGVWGETCNSEEDAMQVDAVHFDSQALTLHAHGRLLREVTGGTVIANISLGAAPAGSTVGEKLKRGFAFLAVRGRQVTEGLCQHLARAGKDSSKCPLAVGYQELHFSFDRLPRTVMAGKYALNIKVVDEAGKPVACARGGLDIARGAKGQLFRRVQEAVAVSGVRALAPSVASGLLLAGAAAACAL